MLPTDSLEIFNLFKKNFQFRAPGDELIKSTTDVKVGTRKNEAEFP